MLCKWLLNERDKLGDTEARAGLICKANWKIFANGFIVSSEWMSCGEPATFL